MEIKIQRTNDIRIVLIVSYRIHIKRNYLPHNKYVTIYLFEILKFLVQSFPNKLKMSQHQSLTVILTINIQIYLFGTRPFRFKVLLIIIGKQHVQLQFKWKHECIFYFCTLVYKVMCLWSIIQDSLYTYLKRCLRNLNLITWL